MKPATFVPPSCEYKMTGSLLEVQRRQHGCLVERWCTGYSDFTKDTMVDSKCWTRSKQSRVGWLLKNRSNEPEGMQTHRRDCTMVVQCSPCHKCVVLQNSSLWVFQGRHKVTKAVNRDTIVWVKATIDRSGYFSCRPKLEWRSQPSAKGALQTRKHTPTNIMELTHTNYRKISNIRRTKSQNLNVSYLGLQLSLRNTCILKPSV